MSQKLSSVLSPSFKALRQQLGLKEPDRRPMVDSCRADDSDFCLEAVAKGFLTRQQMLHAAECYRLGKSRSGKCIFWLIDAKGHCLEGHIGNGWVSEMLKHRYPDLAQYVRTRHCLFGLHLLSANCQQSSVNYQLTIAIVDSEPSAVILSELYPQMLWMAHASFMMLDLLEPLRGHKVTFFPRTDATMENYLDYCELADQARRTYQIDATVSNILEDHASPEQKFHKIDLVDFLFPTTDFTDYPRECKYLCHL